jgi:uncharacterized protein YehS (DUF1456 family)
VTKAPKIKKELAHVNFEAMEAIDIEALFRAIGHQVYQKCGLQAQSALYKTVNRFTTFRILC